MDDRLAEIPVTLEVELARVPLTLADLARLEPGSTLPLCLDQRGLVTLRLGERALARGELVDVDGAVGVRILSMELRWNPAPAPGADDAPGGEVTP
jgi:type III secretion protein Q